MHSIVWHMAQHVGHACSASKWPQQHNMARLKRFIAPYLAMQSVLSLGTVGG